MAAYELVTDSPEQTGEFAGRLAERLQENDVLTLEGDLGAGKTTFTKGLAKGLGVKRNVNSPTFTIIKEYQGRLPLFHMDVYRIDDSFEDLGFDEYFSGGGVTVVEWAHLIEEQLPDERLAVTILRKSEQERTIILKPYGARYELLCKEILK